MKTEIEIQKGYIKNFHGKKIDGLINYSDLTEFRSKSLSKHYSIKYVLNGSELYYVNGKAHQVNSNQFLIVRPGQFVEADINTQSPAQGICIYISPEQIEPRIQSKTSDQYIFPDFPIDATHMSMYGLFDKLSKFRTTLNSDVFLLSCSDYLATFIVDNNQGLSSLNVAKKDTQLSLWNKIERGRQFVHNNIESKLRLNDISKEAYLSPFHFQRTFKAFYQISPSDYVLKTRMQKARELLQQNKCEFREIAYQCGFNDVKYFKKCLQKPLGL